MLTGLMWALYVYLIKDTFQDFLLLIQEAYAWLIHHQPAPRLTAIFPPIRTLLSYAIVIVGNGLIFIGWAQYNKMRFRGNDQRKPILATSHADLAVKYGFSIQQIAEWQEARSLIMTHDDHGTLLRVVQAPWQRPPNQSQAAAQ